MLYHCGLLDDRPDKSRTLEWIKRPAWGSLPTDVERELRMFLAMPGFSIGYLSHVFRTGRPTVSRNLGGYEHWKAEVSANWLSVTREDCIKLAHLRPGTGNVPVICQLRAIQDVKHDRWSLNQVAADYHVTPETLRKWLDNGVTSWRKLPMGFSLLAAQAKITRSL